MNRIMGSALAMAGAFAALTASVSAQVFPERQVRIIVPTAPGGAIDATARIIGEKMHARWGKPVVVENRAGASMRIGAEAVQRAPAGGHSQLVGHPGNTGTQP